MTDTVKKPKWNRPHIVAIRVLLLPAAFLLHLIPHITGLTITLYRWVRYGGEFTVYTQEDKITMRKVYQMMKEVQQEIEGSKTKPKLDI